MQRFPAALYKNQAPLLAIGPGRVAMTLCVTGAPIAVSFMLNEDPEVWPLDDTIEDCAVMFNGTLYCEDMHIVLMVFCVSPLITLVLFPDRNAHACPWYCLMPRNFTVTCVLLTPLRLLEKLELELPRPSTDVVLLQV